MISLRWMALASGLGIAAALGGFSHGHFALGAPPESKPVAGGGGAPHGALSMDQQLSSLAKWLDAKSEIGAPAGVEPSYWKSLAPGDNQVTEERIALGKKLYFDTKLSRDGTLSCATCHDTSRGFSDRRILAEGIGDKLGKRNTPTSMNAAFLSSQFWDGRAATLEDQAKLPILNPIEMGHPDSKAAVMAIAGDPEYQKAFKAAYGRDVNYDDVGRAIASFERTLIFLKAPFDRFAGGDVNAISADAMVGWTLFNGKGRCVSCHQTSSSSPVGSDGRFHNIGVSARHQDFEKLAKSASDQLAKDASEAAVDKLALESEASELGRFLITRNRSDLGAFRTPQIRNVGVTAPYMHDGSMPTLWDVLDHYNKGGEANPYLDGGMEALDLSETEINQLVAFLFSLTDERFSDQNASEFERQKKMAAQKRAFRDEQLASRKVFPFEGRLKEQR